MKLVDIIDFLLNPEKLKQLYDQEKINPESELIGIYMKESLDVESEINLFGIEETSGYNKFEKSGIKYVSLFDVDLALQLAEDLKDLGYSNRQIAERLVAYGINDA